MPTRKASAVWTGGLKNGRGEFVGETGGISGAYTVGSRFEQSQGSNPEELLAAANAACFSMKLSGLLEANGTPPEKIETEAQCTIEKVDGGWKVTTMRLSTRGRVPNADDATFQRLANEAKDDCPISQTLKGNVRLEVDANLEA
jgi:lipoyl-dependent peroxiredoxin